MTPDTAPTHLLYLHGFRSSPASFKARRLLAWLAAHRPQVTALCPQLPPSPSEALARVGEQTAAWPAQGAVVLGSSLGGFYAAEVQRRRGWPAVLMNPAVFPARDLAPWVGRVPAFHDPAQAFDFTAGHLDELRAMTHPRLAHPDRTLALIAQGDELLDWREMAAFCTGATLRLAEGSDHALSDFDDHLPHLLRFLKLCD
jgi:predicted esterase YcpF (UPF0227 family)